MKGFLVVPIIQIFRRLQNLSGITSQRNHIALSDTLYECMKILIFPLIVEIGFKFWLVIYSFGISRWHSDKESQWRRYERSGFSPWVGKIPWSKEMATLSQYTGLENSRTEEPGGLQSMRSQKSWTWLSVWTHMYTDTTISSDVMFIYAEIICKVS